MVRSALSKVAWAGRTASMVFGLALILALSFGVASMALGANGNPFLLGKSNLATAITKLTGNANGSALQVTNSNAGTNDTALDLRVQAGEAPMKVNSNTRVANLNAATAGRADSAASADTATSAQNADQLDGKHANELPGTIASFGAFTGSNSIAGGSTSWVFAGQTATVTTSASQRLFGAAQAPLGLTSGGPQSFAYGLCYQPSAGGAINNFVGGDYSIAQATTTITSYSATESVVPGAGTWKVGFCVRNGGLAAINNNNWVNGWVQVVN